MIRKIDPRCEQPSKPGKIGARPWRPGRFIPANGPPALSDTPRSMRMPRAAYSRDRDATLAMPDRIIPSLQVNMRGGELPEPDASGKRYLKVPINEL